MEALRRHLARLLASMVADTESSALLSALNAGDHADLELYLPPLGITLQAAGRLGASLKDACPELASVSVSKAHLRFFLEDDFLADAVEKNLASPDEIQPLRFSRNDNTEWAKMRTQAEAILRFPWDAECAAAYQMGKEERLLAQRLLCLELAKERGGEPEKTEALRRLHTAFRSLWVSIPIHNATDPCGTQFRRHLLLLLCKLVEVD